ncbi:MAG: enoyl-CoA hydratase/isomerase family protein [Anaerolineales bacterium]|uniref:3-hydroxyacyl-CoA dehydrogenase/enoyl-CoA hydratase family protein n=1 Tax=Promineifilum sp. TaxID=2664178 RepID=UPI001DC4DA8B|nr:enoyl-CoA hydratase/isomerase family protein [Anaerolineales bacterium]MCB8934986.1 enoyl-CoA hydratase/isomerase family protein [Promineifilum sp.]MCO5181773.1 3-hydroxyacyl-CoA dehydrogenase NAD-binding domain-containing protein [Promineifilum sp.]
MTYRIDKVGIVGAGTMGGGIAAHLANIGIPVVLLDIVPPDLSEAEKQKPAARNKIINTLYERMTKARPANLARADRGALITLGNLEDDFEKLADCDWIIEVIIEQLAPKQALMERLESVRKPHAIVSSNTSGIPIGEIAEGRSDEFRAHFLGTHFFNPPRYLKLLEIIPTDQTSPEVVEFMKRYGSEVLGKGVVVCKDTPNFIGNRFFAVASSYGLEHALQNGYTIPEIDAITGPPIGRPKTATYRLLDLVGLDVMAHVNNNLYEAVPHDSYREVLRPAKTTELMTAMIDNKWLGNKAGQGFYKQERVNGAREFWTLVPQAMEYQPSPKVRFDSIGAVRKVEDLGERVRKLLSYDDRAANYARDLLYFGFAYAAYVTPEIAYSLSDVDDAMRWGFSHEAGPFEMWDMLGVAETADKMEALGLAVAPWVKEMLAAGHDSFYKSNGHKQVYDFDSKSYRAAEPDKNIILVSDLRAAGKTVEHNESASLLDMGDGVALFEFHAKMNAIDQDIIDMAFKALERLDSDFDALVIGNNGDNFCAGANLFAVGVAAASGHFDQLDEMIKALQTATFKLRHAPKPVVTAPHQMALGGGVEMAMAGWEAVADHETYMGLVEFGVGLIPAGGGCKEVLRRKVNPTMLAANADVLPPLQEAFEQIALAKVSTSAWEARGLGYLTMQDTIVMNSDHRLAKAKQRALQLVAAGARPPEVDKIYAAGRDALYALKLGVRSLRWGGFASEHDAKVAGKLAYVLTGGDLSAPTWVDPWYILDLEREAFLSLLGEEKTRERMMHMLQTGKPLRN